MRPFIAFSIAALSVAALNVAGPAAADSQNNPLDDGRPLAREWVETGEFAGLSALGPDHVRFSTGTQWQVRAEGDPRTLDRLRFVVRQDSLLVGRRSGDDSKLPAATIHVTAPAIRAATLAGSGTLNVDRLSGSAVSATVAGSGDLTVGTVTTKALTGTVAGSGNLRIAGRAERANLTVAGSGRVHGSALQADRVNSTIAGSGGVTVHSDGTVAAQISGSGDVAVAGRATCRQSRIGSGKLRCGG